MDRQSISPATYDGGYLIYAYPPPPSPAPFQRPLIILCLAWCGTLLAFSFILVLQSHASYHIQHECVWLTFQLHQTTSLIKGEDAYTCYPNSPDCLINID